MIMLVLTTQLAQRTRSLLSILDSVMDIAKATPPVDNKLSRFGNPAFRDFYDRVGDVSAITTIMTTS